MKYEVIITNLRNNADSKLTFKRSSDRDSFVNDMKRSVYESTSKHIRDEYNSDGSVKSFVIYTTTRDLERVTLK